MVRLSAKTAEAREEEYAKRLADRPRPNSKDDIIITIEGDNPRWEAEYAAKLMAYVRSHYKDDVVVIIEHQNTVPAIVHAAGYEGEVIVGDYEHDDIFVVVPKESGPPTVLRLNY